MAKLRVDIPGIGGSLGECVICGKPFLAECLGLGNVQMMGMDGFNRDMPVHPKCFQEVKDVHKWEDLPEGPLRTCFAETAKEQGLTGERP